MPVYKYIDKSGRTVYTDVFPSDSEIQRKPVSETDRRRREEENKQTARTLIKEAQSRIPKLRDYRDFLVFMRQWRTWDFSHVMDELRRSDPQAYLKLMEHPQFRPLREYMVGQKAYNKNLTAAVGMATGSYRGSVEKWLETTVKDLMKRSRWGPYADVLGDKASTLAAAPVSTHSSSRLGHYLKADEARAAGAATRAKRSMAAADTSLRAAKSVGLVRIMGTFSELGLGALDTDVLKGVSAIEAQHKVNLLIDKGYSFSLIDQKRFISAMASARWDEANAILVRVLEDGSSEDE